MATPFDDELSIDTRSLDRLVDFYIESGASGLTVLGIMGEAPKLDGDEAFLVVERVVKRSSVPVIVGVSAPGFAAMRSLVQFSMDRGAAGVMIAPPSSLRTNEQIIGYYSSVVEAIGGDVPFVVQDYPLATSVVMSAKTIQGIAEIAPSFVMLKHEDWPGLEKISQLRQLEREGKLRSLSILSGNGALFLELEMERGADGAMTGYAFPEMLVELVALKAKGDHEAAADLFDSHLPLIRYEQQQGAGLAVRKYVLRKRGVIASDRQRKPHSTLSDISRNEIDHLLSRLARYDKRAAKERLFA